MRILISVFGSFADVYAFCSIGRALKERNHDVVLFARLRYAEAIAEAGLSCVPIGPIESARKLASKPRHFLQGMGEAIMSEQAERFQKMSERMVPGETLV